MCGKPACLKKAAALAAVNALKVTVETNALSPQIAIHKNPVGRPRKGSRIVSHGVRRK